MKVLSCDDFGDTRITYIRDEGSGTVGWSWVPAGRVSAVVPPRSTLRGAPCIDAMPGDMPWPARVLEPLVQIKLAGDPYPGGFAQGHTMRGSPAMGRFVLDKHYREPIDRGVRVVTVLTSPEKLQLLHHLEWKEGSSSFQVRSAVVNGGEHPVRVEMLSSFTLGGLTPFHRADAPGRLAVHRFRSAWSAEGRHECRSLEDLHLERSWSGAAVLSERFGQVGSMPVRRWFPFVALEDASAGVFWGAQLSWAGSWQLEVSRQHDDVCISGGLADREFGHWTKVLQPGDRLDSPLARLACVHGTFEDLCERLTAAQADALHSLPPIEEDLPVAFNEWCTTWGEPTQDRLLGLADSLAELDVRYLVIDAGWFKREGGSWDTGHGDWVPSPRLFPDGIEVTAALIRERGLIPGLWFEMETVGATSDAFHRTELLLCRDGCPVTVRGRRFWDLNNEAAVEYLSERVIGLLERGGFGYLKIDYNESIGIGCDHPDSQGEGLRRQVLASYRLIERIRARLPDLVIENCSAGGHRLEPSMIGLSAMSSFSDAHEVPEVPLIAANLHSLMLPRQTQIWAVLHPQDGDRRLVYSLTATFLGRMGLSGGVDRLSSHQRGIVRNAIEFYRRAVSIIRDGRSFREGDWSPAWRHLEGWQGVVRFGLNEDRALVVVHGFSMAPEVATFPSLRGEGWQLEASFLEPGIAAPIWADALAQVPLFGDFSSCALLLKR